MVKGGADTDSRLQICSDRSGVHLGAWKIHESSKGDEAWGDCRVVVRKVTTLSWDMINRTLWSMTATAANELCRAATVSAAERVKYLFILTKP